MKSLIDYLEQIPDPRKAKGQRHKQSSNLVIIIMGLLCGCTSINGLGRFGKSHETQLAEKLPLPKGKAPSSDTLKRLLKAISYEHLCNTFNEWMQQYKTPEKTSIDGKVLRSTVKNVNNSSQSFAEVVSFFGSQSHLIKRMGLFETDEGNELQQVQKMIEVFDLKGNILSLDALHCQKKTVKLIIESGNDYFITVKKNQPKLHQDIHKTVAKGYPEKSYSWKQKGHGHPSQCRIKVWTASKDMQQQWTGLSSYACITRTTTRKGKTSQTNTYYIISGNHSAYKLSTVAKEHRKIENKLHWVKDVIYNEDNCLSKDANQAANLSTLRSISFNLLVKQGFKSITEGIAQMGENIHKLWNIITQPF